MSENPRDSLRPFVIVVQATTTSRAAFVKAFSDDKFLLVDLVEQPGSLVSALLECPTDPSQPWYPRTDTTGTGTSIATGLSMAELDRRVASIPPPMDGEMLADILCRPHFAMPLRKRKETQIRDAERISIGRSHFNDVVLFHGTVSKLHACIEYDDRARLYVCDQGSTNFTRVENRIIEPFELVHFSLGDTVRFGDVTARVCEAATLWDALNVDGDCSRPRLDP